MIDRIVCWFSCGAASAVATKLAITENAGRLPLVVARCVIDEEHPDNERFAAECEAWFGMPILNLTSAKYGSSIYNVFEQRGYISGINGAPCTLYLKKEVRRDFQKPTDRHVFGYCADEQGRWDDFLDANNIDAVAPLLDRGLTHSDSLAMIERAGIELPTMYQLGYHHNNCIGCAKATGQGYWNKIRQDFPPYFDRMASLSRKLGVRLIRIDDQRAFLDELQPGTGDYQSEPEIQCGIFCEMAEREISAMAATQPSTKEE
jgi:hypothetical protein